jgi:hypothetical protein
MWGERIAVCLKQMAKSPLKGDLIFLFYEKEALLFKELVNSPLTVSASSFKR